MSTPTILHVVQLLLLLLLRATTVVPDYDAHV
jgi:hypothetical protein